MSNYAEEWIMAYDLAHSIINKRTGSPFKTLLTILYNTDCNDALSMWHLIREIDCKRKYLTNEYLGILQELRNKFQPQS